MLQLPDTELSYWREAYPSNAIYPQIHQDMAIDVVIVGAGITGLTSAYLLKQAGFSVAVLEKDTVGGGTTGRTTGKVTSQHNLIYAKLKKHSGTEAARIYGEANQAAVQKVAAIVKAEKIDCDWQRADNYVFTADLSEVAAFKQEAKLAAELGLPATFETTTPLPFNVQAAVKFSNQANFHSQKYLLGLARAINGSGSYVFENSEATGIRDGNLGRVKTKQASITAKHIIVATNVPTLPLMARGGYCTLEYPRESYIVAGLLDKSPPGMYISPDNNHYSILAVDVVGPVGASGQQSLLIGGESNISGLRISKQAKFQKLADYAEKKFGVTQITHCWSDRDYLAYDDIPLIGKLYPWSKNLYVATAFMKWGLSNGTVAGLILTDLITGKPNPWAATFNSNRLSPVKAFPRIAIKNLSGKA